jgi:hypothetical protein
MAFRIDSLRIVQFIIVTIPPSHFPIQHIVWCGERSLIFLRIINRYNYIAMWKLWTTRQVLYLSALSILCGVETWGVLLVEEVNNDKRRFKDCL